MRKKTKKLIEQAEILLILLSIVFLIWVIIQFTNNIHNVDLYININRMVSAINDAGFKDVNNNSVYINMENITDTGSDYQTFPLSSYYISSSEDLKKWFVWGLVDCLILGVLLSRRLK